jgi:hypothetical protein
LVKKMLPFDGVAAPLATALDRGPTEARAASGITAT